METVVEADARELTGSANARRLRREGKLPAVINTRDGKTTHIQIDKHGFELMLSRHASENLIVDVTVGGKAKQKVLLKDVQHHTLTGDVLHIDMVELSMTEKMKVNIPVTLVGESAGVEFGGTLDHVLREIEVECLPTDLVETFELDVSKMEIGDTLYVRDIVIGSVFTLLTSDEFAVAHVAAPRVEAEPTEEEEGEAAEGEEGAEPEVIGKKDEGEEGGDAEESKDENA